MRVKCWQAWIFCYVLSLWSGNKDVPVNIQGAYLSSSFERLYFFVENTQGNGWYSAAQNTYQAMRASRDCRPSKVQCQTGRTREYPKSCFPNNPWLTKTASDKAGLVCHQWIPTKYTIRNFSHPTPIKYHIWGNLDLTSLLRL